VFWAGFVVVGCSTTLPVDIQTEENVSKRRWKNSEVCNTLVEYELGQYVSMCVFVCVCVCVCVYIHTYIHTYIHIYIYIYIYKLGGYELGQYVSVCVDLYVFLCMCASLCAYKSVRGPPQ
jgi:hypothetical protein